MGYSISIQVSSIKIRKRMLHFMEQNFRRWCTVCGSKPDEWQGSASNPTDDIFNRPKAIGFHYQSGMYGFERDYIYSVLRWMAIKVGVRRSKMKTDETDEGEEVATFPEPVPYYNYDGDPTFTPILVVTEEQATALTKNQRHWAVDEWGIRIGSTVVDSQIMSCIGISGPNGPDILTESKALGEPPKEDGKEREAWFDRRRVVYLKYLKPEIDTNIEQIRQEIRRLDQLWTSEV